MLAPSAALGGMRAASFRNRASFHSNVSAMLPPDGVPTVGMPHRVFNERALATTPLEAARTRYDANPGCDRGLRTRWCAGTLRSTEPINWTQRQTEHFV